MPTYEYRCLKCKKRFDASQRMSDKPLSQCIHCKGKVERLIGAGAGFIFKGSGFYETDYKRKSEPPKTPSPPPEAKNPKEKKSEPAVSEKKESKKKKE